MSNPHELSENLIKLSEEASRTTSRLGELRKDKAVRWLEYRKTAKTDKEATMRLEASVEGQEEIKLSYIEKALAIEIRAIKMHLRVLENESRNLY
jgi:hypothetical protein